MHVAAPLSRTERMSFFIQRKRFIETYRSNRIHVRLIVRLKVAAAKNKNRKSPCQLAGKGFLIVGVAGFEPTASSSRTTRATGLRYTPRNLPRSDRRKKAICFNRKNLRVGFPEAFRASNSSVGLAGFEPTTSSTPCWRDTRLRYTPREL